MSKIPKLSNYLMVSENYILKHCDRINIKFCLSNLARLWSYFDFCKNYFIDYPCFLSKLL